MAMEVVAVRRDGFEGEIELLVNNLPAGVTATGLKIPKGKSRGIVLLTAEQDASRDFSLATFKGRSSLDDQIIERPCRIADMAWPVKDSWSEIPAPRLLDEAVVSVGGSEFAPLSIAAAKDQIWEVIEGEKLVLPLTLTQRSEFSGSILGLKTMGFGFEGTPKFEISLGGRAEIPHS